MARPCRCQFYRGSQLCDLQHSLTESATKAKLCGFKDRYGSHKKNAFNPKKKKFKQHFYCSIRKYGIQNFKFFFRQTFKFEGLEELSKEERKAFYKKIKQAYLYPCETYWIRKLGLLNRKKGYNKKESGEGGSGYVWTDEQRAARIGNTNSPTKAVTRCEILEDGKTHQKVRLTQYRGCRIAERANPGCKNSIISACCREERRSHGGYLWWFCKDTDVYDKEIIVERVGFISKEKVKSEIISKLEVAKDEFLEQWHASMKEAELTLSTTDKKILNGNISLCCSGKRKSHQGYEFRRVTTEKREDFDKDGKRIVNSKKRKRN